MCVYNMDNQLTMDVVSESERKKRSGTEGPNNYPWYAPSVRIMDLRISTHIPKDLPTEVGVQRNMNFPLELMNHILSYRPCHPVAVLMKQKLKTYYEKDMDYYEQFNQQFIYSAFLGHEVTSFRIFVHKIKSFQEWYFQLKP